VLAMITSQKKETCPCLIKRSLAIRCFN